MGLKYRLRPVLKALLGQSESGKGGGLLNVVMERSETREDGKEPFEQTPLPSTFWGGRPILKPVKKWLVQIPSHHPFA